MQAPALGACVTGLAVQDAPPSDTSRARGFTVVALVGTVFLVAASAPSPLYGLYAQRWHFSPTTLTAVFAVYAVALLAALLTAGALSDAVGRRPVIAAALALQVVAMVVFLLATGVGWLFAARVVQGVATGLATAAVAAALIDLEPPAAPGRGALVNAVSPTLGLALGALLSGALVQYGSAPFRLVFVVLLVAFAALAAALALVPEPVTVRSRGSLRVRVGVEPRVRPAFLAATPALVATWALGGLYLSLGPSVTYLLVHSTNRLVGGATVAVLSAAGGIASLLTRAWVPSRSMVLGCVALVVGVGLTVTAIAGGWPALFFVGSAVAGTGFGTAFLGTFRTLAGLASPQGRGELVAAVYVVAYLAFSVPAVVAGVLTVHLGLRDTAVGYGVVVAVLSLVAIPATLRATARR